LAAKIITVKGHNLNVEIIRKAIEEFGYKPQ